MYRHGYMPADWSMSGLSLILLVMAVLVVLYLILYAIDRKNPDTRELLNRRYAKGEIGIYNSQENK